jgi:hypothetical protein
MDDQMRNDLLAKLADAKKLEADAVRQFQALAANIEQIRETLGNPYFYSGRSGDDPESKANFTGYTSHEPAFNAWQRWQEASRQVRAIREQLPG